MMKLSNVWVLGQITIPMLISVGVSLTLINETTRAVSKPSAIPSQSDKRTFNLKYATRVTGLKPGTLTKIWIPVAATSPDQNVELLGKKLPSIERASQERDAEYGNEILFVEAKADDQGEIPISLSYKITRFEVRGSRGNNINEKPGLLERFLQPDALVPTEGKPLELLKDQTLPANPLEATRKLYDLVNQHMKYSKDKPGWGRGDSIWACENKSGNCTDFHSLFISLARSRKIPAKFEIGFSIPAKEKTGPIKGYHCWGKFFIEGKGWVPVDISEANKEPSMIDYYFGNLTADRVAFSTGRDIKLIPSQAGKPVNFFVFPYVEIEGKPYPSDKVITQISFQDE